jgi:hypothetical protein
VEIRRDRSKTIIGLVILFVLALLVTCGTLGYFWYRKTHQPTPPSNTTGGSISLDTSKKLETEDLQTALVIPSSTDKPGDTIKLSVLSIKTPKSWRTLNGKNVMNTPLENAYVESFNDILAQLIMVPEDTPTDPMLAINGLNFYNITSWLKKASNGTTGQVTPAMKAAYVANIENLSKGQATDKNVCNKGAGVLNVTICGDLLKPTPIITADNSLAGVAYFGTTAQAASYDPQVFVFLTGKVKDQQILAYGTFHLLDKASHQLDVKNAEGLKAAWDSFIKGTIPSDTQQLYQHVVDAMKSVTITAN